MPRNSSGTYSLPQAAFVSGTTIQSSAMNSNLSDIATALTQSVASTGVTPMTGPILGASGTVSAPSYTFNSNQATGFYLAGVNQVGWAANGVNGALFNADLSVTWAGSHTFPSGKSVTMNGQIIIGTSAPQFFQCYFQNTNSSTCTLVPLYGNLIFIGGQNYPIPNAGVTITTSTVNNGGAAAASSFYYVYAYISGGNVTLEGSTTAYVTTSVYGCPTKSGDSSRTLVGVVYTTAGSAFADTDMSRFVLSYWNRKPKGSISNITGGNITLSATTFSELSNGGGQARNQFLSWPEDSVQVSYMIQANYNASSPSIFGGLSTNKNGLSTPVVYSESSIEPSFQASTLTDNTYLPPNYFSSYTAPNYTQAVAKVSGSNLIITAGLPSAGGTHTSIIILG